MKIFIVTYSSDSYEDWREYLVFATQDREKAEKYIEKANLMLEKWKQFYDMKSREESIGGFEQYIFTPRAMKLDEINCFYIQEVELR